MLKVFKISILLFFFSLINTSLLYSNNLNEIIKKAEKSVSDAEDAFAIGSKGHFQSLEDLLKVRKKLVKAKDMLSEIKNSDPNKAIKILDELEPLTKYIIEHSGLDPKH
jgi:hypothetical protein|tara:strand:+ start:357 stop:683 length:327 start_codon:yes stop_codon:yes gene_type:complete